MANEPPPPAQEAQPTIDELKKMKEFFDAQKAAADAEKAALDAKRALEGAQQTPSPAAAATAQQVAEARAAKEVADAEKALADAQKARSDAELAAFKSALGDVPASGISGTVTASEKTGELEAALLAMRAVREAASAIGSRIRAVLATNATIVVVNAAETPTFQHLLAYDAEVAVIHRVLDAALAAAKGTPSKSTEALPVVGAAGMALDAASKLLSFFRTDVTVKGVDVTIEDRVALDEVANDLAQSKANKVFHVRVPSIYDPVTLTTRAAFFLDDAASLTAKRTQLEPFIASATRLAAELTQGLATPGLPAATRATIEAQLNAQTALAASLKSAAALLDAWYTRLGATDAKGVAAIVHVTRERSIANSLLADGNLLIVKVQRAGGGFMTKKNLWTVFGGMPLYHMGGAAVSFTLITGKDGLVKAAGVAPIHGGFIKAGRVRDALDR